MSICDAANIEMTLSLFSSDATIMATCLDVLDSLVFVERERARPTSSTAP
jgi:hypothetical protein